VGFARTAASYADRARLVADRVQRAGAGEHDLGIAGAIDEPERLRRRAGLDQHAGDERAVRRRHRRRREPVDVLVRASIARRVERADHGEPQRGVARRRRERVEERAQRRIIHRRRNLTSGGGRSRPALPQARPVLAGEYELGAGSGVD
jgi:hypothetical protein